MNIIAFLVILFEIGSTINALQKLPSNMHIMSMASMQNPRSIQHPKSGNRPYYLKRSTTSSSLSSMSAQASNLQPQSSLANQQQSVVAIPLYIRNDRHISAQKTPLLYEMFMSALSDNSHTNNRHRTPVVTSVNNPALNVEQLMSVSPLKSHSTKSTSSGSLKSAASANSYNTRHVTSADTSYSDSNNQAIAAAGYSAASPHSHLNIAAGYGHGKPLSGHGATASHIPTLKAVAFDDHQKNAFQDFTGVLDQGFELKELNNQELHNLPSISPNALTGASQNGKKSASSSQSYGGGSSSGGYAQSSGGGSSSYGRGGSGGGGSSYAGSSGSGSSYGQSSGQNYGQSYGQSSGRGGSSGAGGYGQSSASSSSQYDPTGYGYSAPSSYSRQNAMQSSGGYGNSDQSYNSNSGGGGGGYSSSSQGGSYGGSSGDNQGYGGSSYNDYSTGSQGGSSYGGGQGQQSTGSAYGGSGGGSPQAYMTAYPVSNDFATEIHSAYQNSGSPVPYVSSHNPFGDTNQGTSSEGATDYASSSSSDTGISYGGGSSSSPSSMASSSSSGYDGGQQSYGTSQTYGDQASYSQPSTSYSSPQTSTSYSSGNEDASSSSSSSSQSSPQSYGSVNYANEQSTRLASPQTISSPLVSYGQSVGQNYPQDKTNYAPITSSRIFSSGQSYNSPLITTNYGQNSYHHPISATYQESNEQPITLYNSQDQSSSPSSSPNHMSKNQVIYGAGNNNNNNGQQNYNSYTGPSYQLATQSVNQSPYNRPTFYSITSTNNPQNTLKQTNYDINTSPQMNEYYSDPNCLPGTEYASTVQNIHHQQSPSISYNSPKASIASLPVTGNSRPTSYASVISDQTKYTTNILHPSTAGSSTSSSSSLPPPPPPSSSSSSSSSISSSSPSSSLVSSSSSSNSGQITSSNLQTFEPEELDPSKLDLKIVHLPISFLKKLVSSGDVTLGGQSSFVAAA